MNQRFDNHYYEIMDKLREDIPRYVHRPKTELLLNTYLRLMEEMENRNATDQEIAWAHHYTTGNGEVDDPRIYLKPIDQEWWEQKYRNYGPRGYHCPDLSTPIEIEAQQGALTAEPWPTGNVIHFTCGDDVKWTLYPHKFDAVYHSLKNNGRYVDNPYSQASVAMAVANDIHMQMPATLGLQLIHITPIGKSQLMQVFADVVNRPKADW